MIGTKLSHYTIVEEIGAGGMGVVYRARDDRLPRDVAIKILPPGSIADDGTRRRFRREAEALARVSHPNIETVIEFDTQEGVDFLVLELVAGETLSERLRVGPVSEREVARLGTQLAAGIAAAHREGVLHRDIKPGNLRLTSDGLLKVLDFGIAKLMQVGAEATTETLTETDRVPGTLPYMAPEQLMGHRVDERTDVYGVGAVLYEMAAGRRAFPQTQSAELLSAILHHIPAAPSTMNHDISQALDRVILKALDKDPDRRYQTAREIGVDLQRLMSTSPVLVTSPGRRSWGVAVGMVLALLALVGALSGIRLLRERGPGLGFEFKQRQLTSDPLDRTIFDAAISPDGKFLAYSNRKGIHLSLVNTGEIQTIALPRDFPTDLQDQDLAWFPDGTKLLSVNSDGNGRSSIWSVALIGGTAHRLRNESQGASVSPDGGLIAFGAGRGTGNEQREIWVMETGGGKPRRILFAGMDEWFLLPTWSPDGERIAYQRRRRGPHGMEVSIESVDLEGRRPVVIVPGLAFSVGPFRLDFVWLSDGRLVFARPSTDPQSQGWNLWEIRTHAGKPRGKARRLTNWAGFYVRDLSASLDGRRLVYLKDTYQEDVYVGRLQYPGPRLETPQRLTLDDRTDIPSSWSHDSRAVLFESNRRGNPDIFRQELDQLRPETIVMSPEPERWPSMSPDGAWILFEAASGRYPWSARHLMRSPAAGGAPESVFTASGDARYRCSLPPANLCIVSEVLREEIVFSILDPAKGKGDELARLEVEVLPWYSWDLSPDGSTIALIDGTSRLRFVGLSGGGSRQVLIPPVKATQPLGWSADGTGVFLTGVPDSSGAIIFVGLDGQARRVWEPGGLSAGLAFPCASPDGQHLAFLSSSRESNAWMLEDF